MKKWFPKCAMTQDRELCEVLLNPKLSQLDKVRIKEYVKIKTIVEANNGLNLECLKLN